jgi:hypothetical protein
LLRLAERQGLLYAHQLPAPSNGAHATAAEPDAAARHFLNALLNGQTGHLTPCTGDVPAGLDAALERDQRDAISRAMNTPDLCLIQGLPGTGRTRVAAEVVARAAQSGQRVLLLASSGTALDVILGRVGCRDAVCAVRCLARDETPEKLAPEIRPLLFAERVRTLAERGIAAAQSGVEHAERRCAQGQPEEAVWPELGQCVQDELALHKRLAELEAERTRAGTVADEADRFDGDTSLRPDSPFTRALRDCREKRAAAVSELGKTRDFAESRRAERAEEVRKLTEQLEKLRPLAAAKGHGQWWSSNFWRATFRGDIAANLADLERRHQEAQASALESEGEVRLVDEKCRQTEDLYRQQRAAAIAKESSHRLEKCAKREAELRASQQAAQERWQKVCGRLEESVRPVRCDGEALEVARRTWQLRCEHDQEQLALARDWLARLSESVSSWPARLRRLANVVAATTATLPTDEQFGDASAGDSVFDLLVLEDAEQLTESEFLKVARRARRWVLVAEQTLEPHEEVSRTSGPAPRKPAKPAGPGSALRSSCFQRLWQHLHGDPSRLPYSWFEEGGRLYCRLIPLTAEQRKRLECESVVDRPEIELRILTLPGDRPLLAEVAFPATFGVPQAKEFIYRELQELPIQSPGRSLRWEDGADSLILRLADAPPRDATRVVLEPGIEEWVGREFPGREAPGPWHTCRVEFRTDSGWTRQRAEEWIHHRLRLRDLGRTVRLDTPFRMRPELAEVVWDLIGHEPLPRFPAASELGALGALASRPPVQFLPVPPPPRDKRPRDRNPATKPAGLTLPRHGAGLELDLAGSGRHTDLLPDDMRQALPARGLVNYLEAQAVVRTLEEMVGDAVLCATLARVPRPAARGPQVAVISPSSAQVELLRRLIERSTVLARAPWAVEVNVPAAFRHRECWVGLVSLTRSHSHRSVTWADTPQTLALALTRARWQLLLFGDPGTLARRADWQGPVDHLNEAAAERERQLVAKLVGYLQGQGTHRRSFHLREGNGA